MLTIVVFHCSSGCVPPLIASFLGNPWNVPIFFIVAGFFLKTNSMAHPIPFLKGKFRRLYLPATIVYAICILLHNAFVKIGWYPLGGVHPSNGIPYSLYGFKETCLGLIKVLFAGGSGELIMGAMWFLYTLLYSFVGLVILYWLVSKFWHIESMRFKVMTLLLLVIAVASCMLTQKLDITISRISTSLTAMFLIWLGMIWNQHLKLKATDTFVFITALIVFVHCVIMQVGDLKLAKNEYQDLVSLTVGSTAAIYVWWFIAKKLEHCIVGRVLALIGKESLYVMMFHILGFFICNSLMVELGVFHVGDEKGLYTYAMSGNCFLLLTYVSFGIFVPLAIIYSYRNMTITMKTLFHKINGR